MEEKEGLPQRILLVEDHPDVRVLLEHVLLGAGYPVDIAETVAGGHAFLATNVYSLVITDGRLPDGSGVQVADAAKQLGAKTLVISGYALQFSKTELAGHEYLLKPIRPSELLLTLRRLIGEI